MRPVKSKEPASSVHEHHLCTTFLLVIKNKDVNGNKWLSRVFVLPLYYVRVMSCVAEQPPKGSSRQLSEVNIHQSKEGYSRMQNSVKYGGPLFSPDLHCFHSMGCSISVQRTKGRLRKKPKHKHKQNCSRERCPSTLFSSATMQAYTNLFWATTSSFFVICRRKS